MEGTRETSKHRGGREDEREREGRREEGRGLSKRRS
jgi:hypothetical protein